ncbi:MULTISPECIES: ROK family protein [Caldilinea]|uniref:Putative sugar kinase n=1 Tax=Caldilinea aerophila (strain DSM 14535 / JCM 11387 / NBRC 104270 / STL-6-O1) TaxID=926550 RepID=I0HZA8_CALAS|nr:MULTISPECIES: ROK family protein [Caldilinea]BAL98345.1 putative sugar kinase [Caldilinea aerophila DSM 14535 = NBRC 104270]GIV75062.1 MAG: glucokinase [Caldilinea sp.]
MQLTEPVLVFDIGGTKVAAAVLEPDFSLHQRREIATQAAEGPAQVVERVAALGHAVMSAYAEGGKTIRLAGVASAGQIDRESGVVRYATFHLPGWSGFPLGQRLASALGLTVFVDNDVNCHALAEAVLGAGRPYRHFLLAAVGTGVGGGIVIDGKLYRGRLGAAGEIGQVLVEPQGGRPCSDHLSGCLEVYAATSVMLQQSGYASLQALAQAYGDGEVIPAVDEAARWLGWGLASIAHVLAPEAILIGGSAAVLGERYLAAVKAAFVARTLPSHQDISLLFTQLGADSGLIGAGLVASEGRARK